MPTTDLTRLRRLTTFPALVDYLRDELDWPIEVEDADDLAFDYEPAELGLDPIYAVKIKAIKQIRPLVDRQPWGVFFIEFESKRLPVVALRRILQKFVSASRSSDPNRPVWKLDDLLFISALGEVSNRAISFAHFEQRADQPPELHTFSWDSRESHFYYLKNFNLEALRWPPRDKANPVVWRETWRQAFPVEHRYVITKSQELAQQMATHAARVRQLVGEVYALEIQHGPLHQLYNSFKEVLLHDLTPAAFADMVAQTVAYGLFSAASQSGEELSYDHLVDLIPATNPFLKELLAELTQTGRIDLAELGVDQLVELLRCTDMPAILHDFGRQSGAGREDPVIHFYESFLSEYDKSQKVQRGVFYTPDPVVSYIVRSVDYLLKTEFGLPDGLADTTISPETGESWVQILDPATGTGTFLAHVIDQIEQTVKAKPDVDWNRYVTEQLLPRLHGFELLMAPYAVAHMKLGLKLKQTGYNFSSDERLRIYLGNALDEPIQRHETLALSGFLSKESNEVAYVKSKTPVGVIIGNPPYSVSSANKGKYIEGLMELYKTTVRGEKQIAPLSDDYIKFIRFAHERIERTGYGIIGIITNRVYLDGLIHRGMREELLKSFSKIYVLDLQGSTIHGLVTPYKDKDQNVFDIQQGVAIAFFVKNMDDNALCEIRHADLWGSRDDKYTWLLNNTVHTTHWRGLTPSGSFFFFVPKDFSFREEYEHGWILVDIFKTHISGIQSKRDDFALDFNESSLRERIELFRSKTLDDYEIKLKFQLQDTPEWQVSQARAAVRLDKDWQNKFYKCLYRPFDERWIFYSEDILARSRYQLMHHQLYENIALITVRRSRTEELGHYFISDALVNKVAISSADDCHVFSLYLHTTPETTRGTLFATQTTSREPNLAPAFTRDISTRLGLRFIRDGQGDLTTTLGPEDIFHYAYAVFHSPTYRSRYAELLKIDFPRLPLTTSLPLFRALCQFGADLVALHLLEDDYAAASWNQSSRGREKSQSPLQAPSTTFVKRATGATVGAVSKGSAYERGKVYLDTSHKARSSYFEGVPEEVWNFHIGGYQVCHKWLYDRSGSGGEPGRTLSEEDISHYQRVVVALNETIRLMGEIDAVIEEHGGWPLVGSVKENA